MSSQIPSVTPATVTNNRPPALTTFDNDGSSSSSPSDASNQASPRDDNAELATPIQQPRSHVPLEQRLPKTSTVIEVLSSLQKVKDMLSYSHGYFDKEEDKLLLFDHTFWETVAISLVNATAECITGKRQEIKKMSRKYRLLKKDIIATIGKHDIYDVGDASIDIKQRTFASRTMMLIGGHFIDEYSKLIKSAWGKDILSTQQQIDVELKVASAMDVGQLFGDDVRLAEHAYYVVGFLNHAGINESARRSDKNDIGACIEGACKQHYYAANDKDELEELRKKLPTGLVDRRITNGGLKYPDEQFYKVFGSIERAYSIVVTPDNFLARGGMLLAEIRSALCNNEQLLAQFTLLLDGKEYEDGAISGALAYFIKVFSNLRAKDVALKYNSNLNGSNTVGLRQTLAGGIIMGKSKGKKKKKQSTNDSEKEEVSKYKNLKVVELKDILKKRRLHVTGRKAVLIERLEEDDEKKKKAKDDANAKEDDANNDTIDEDDESSDEEAEDKTDEEAQHEVMKSALDTADSEMDDDFHSADKVSSRDVIADAVENDMS